MERIGLWLLWVAWALCLLLIILVLRANGVLATLSPPSADDLARTLGLMSR